MHDGAFGVHRKPPNMRLEAKKVADFYQVNMDKLAERVRRETRERRIWLSPLSEPEEVRRDLSGDS